MLMVQCIYVCSIYVSVGGVMASMVAFQAVDPGSTPGRRNENFCQIYLRR